METSLTPNSRIHSTITAPASTTHVYTRIPINFTASGTVDFTLRVGWAQLEDGDFPSTPMVTEVGSTNARGGDKIEVANPEILIPAGLTGTTLYVDMTLTTDPTSWNETVVPIGWSTTMSFDDDNQYISISNTGVVLAVNRYNASSTLSSALTPGFSKGDRIKIAAGFEANSCIVCVDGTLGSVDSDGIMASGPAAYFAFGTAPWGGASNSEDMTLHDARVFHRKLSNSEMQILTT